MQLKKKIKKSIEIQDQFKMKKLDDTREEKKEKHRDTRSKFFL